MYQPINAMLLYFLVVLLVKVTYMYNKPSTEVYSFVLGYKHPHKSQVVTVPQSHCI